MRQVLAARASFALFVPVFAGEPAALCLISAGGFRDMHIAKIAPAGAGGTSLGDPCKPVQTCKMTLRARNLTHI